MVTVRPGCVGRLAWGQVFQVAGHSGLIDVSSCFHFFPSLRSVSDFERNSFSFGYFLTPHLPGRILKWN